MKVVHLQQTIDKSSAQSARHGTLNVNDATYTLPFTGPHIRQDTGIYNLPNMASLTVHELDCQYTEDVGSVMPDRLLGTLFYLSQEQCLCLCLTIGSSSNISTSPTSTLSRAHSTFFLQLTRYINLLLTYRTLSPDRWDIMSSILWQFSPDTTLSHDLSQN